MAQTAVAEVYDRAYKRKELGSLGSGMSFLSRFALTVGAIGGARFGETHARRPKLLDRVFRHRSLAGKKVFQSSEEFMARLRKDPFETGTLSARMMAEVESLAAKSGLRRAGSQLPALQPGRGPSRPCPRPGPRGPRGARREVWGDSLPGHPGLALGEERAHPSHPGREPGRLGPGQPAGRDPQARPGGRGQDRRHFRLKSVPDAVSFRGHPCGGARVRSLRTVENRLLLRYALVMPAYAFRAGPSP